MGFISFNEKYYRRKLAEYENKLLSGADIRRFETLYSQDLFMQYSSYCDRKFYVNVSADESVREKTLSEIAGLMR